MRKISAHRWIQVWLVLLPAAIASASAVDRADRPGWQRRQVNWRMTGGSRIRAISYPNDKPVPTLAQKDSLRPSVTRKKTFQARATSLLSENPQQSLSSAIVNVIDSPPIDGFIPWIAVSITDAFCTVCANIGTAQGVSKTQNDPLAGRHLPGKFSFW
ncbi:MAG: hypothetical protein MUO33_00535, partial [Sedimentisphaerales bacterium]|nr:hypothetical protein [Sedimentisphaerales bacterium]